MYKAIGAGNPLESQRAAFDALWEKAESATFLADKLDEIVNARHVVAHSGNALGISRGNLSEWRRFIAVIGTVLDARLASYVANVCAQLSPP